MEPTSDPEAVEVPEPGPVAATLLVPPLFPLFVLEISPLECAPPAEEDSPFCALFKQERSESCPCPDPLDCMFVPRLLTMFLLK